jgi:hypothetical protein
MAGVSTMTNRFRIEHFSFDRALTRGYLALCHDLYAGDRNWIQPLSKRLLFQFDPGFAFYQKTGNQHRNFVALRGANIIGHLSAFVNHEMRDPQGGQVGGVGFFECIDDYPVAQSLLARAVEWLRAENDVHRIWGPINFDIWHGYRFMTHGFDQKTFYGEPYNKVYYPEFFKRFGFETLKTWCSLELTGRATWESVVAKYEPRYRRLTAEGYRMEPADLSDPDVVVTLHALISGSFRHFLAYTPIDLTEFKQLFGVFLRIVDRRFLTLIYDYANQAAGFSIAYPDLADAVRSMRGSDNMLARMRFYQCRRTGRGGLGRDVGRREYNASGKRIIYSSLGITPAEVEKHHGLGTAATYEAIHRMLDAGYETTVLTLMADDSPARLMSAIRARIDRAQRTYALYGLVVK